MSAGFDADDVTLKDLFIGEDRYKVPSYQRPYSWQPDDHVLQLWDDLVDAWQNDPDADYFMGSVILVEQEGPYDVLDGQQRLTTFMILYAVLRDFYLEHLAEHQRTQVRDALVVRTAKGEPYRLTTSAVSGDEADFHTSILNGVDFDQKDNYAEAAKVTRSKLEDVIGYWGAEGSGNDKSGERRSLAQFFKFLQERLVFVKIWSKDLANAVRVFQTVNTRGKDLTVSDKTKSYLLSKTRNDDEERAIIGKWNELTIIFDKDYDAIDNILGSYRLYLKEEEPEISVYEELKAEFDDALASEASTVVIADDLRDYAEAHPDTWRPTSAAYFSLTNLRHSQHWKTVLATAEKHDFKDVDGLLGLLVGFYYSFWIAGYTAEKIKKPSRKIISMIKKGASLKEIGQRLDRKKHRESVPERMAQALHEDLYDGSPESWLVPLLKALEYQRATEVGDPIIAGKELHVEHILPKAESIFDDDQGVGYWKERFSREEAHAVKHKLGNLVLLEGDYNKRAQTRPFPHKRELYTGKGRIEGGIKAKNTDFSWTRDAVNEFEEWSSESICKFRAEMIQSIAFLVGISAESLGRD